MSRFHVRGRTLAISGVLVPLLALFVYVAIRSGPLAPVLVTATTAEIRSIRPELFGIGTVEARFAYRIGPVLAGRVKQVSVDVGDRVSAGQLLGEMDPVDLGDRIAALEAALKRAESQVIVAAAQVNEAAARLRYAEQQSQRYAQLVRVQTATPELLDAKRQERAVAAAGLEGARAGLDSARLERTRAGFDLDALVKQQANLRLIAPVDGLVVARRAEPGATVVAGQPVVEMVDPAGLWINARFDQLSATGLRADLSAQVELRSEAGRKRRGKVLRVEPLADAVTEEMLAKIAFDMPDGTLPPIGELAEVSVSLPALPPASILPNACVHRNQGKLGVWVTEGGRLRFAVVMTGVQDMEGRIQILAGLQPGERVVVHSRSILASRSRVKVVDRLPDGAP